VARAFTFSTRVVGVFDLVFLGFDIDSPQCDINSWWTRLQHAARPTKRPNSTTTHASRSMTSLCSRTQTASLPYMSWTSTYGHPLMIPITRADAEPFLSWWSTLRFYQEALRETGGTQRPLKTLITCMLLTVVRWSAIVHEVTAGLAPGCVLPVTYHR
jgi:hypothetical protein